MHNFLTFVAQHISQLIHFAAHAFSGVHIDGNG